MPKKKQSKPVTVSISIRLPEDRPIEKLSILPTGEIVLWDKDGRPVVPPEMERTVHFDRVKGPKVQSRSKVSDHVLTVGGLAELARYDRVYVIDTNTRVIDGRRVSAACFMWFRFIPQKEGRFRIEWERRLNVYEFHDVSGNPEMLAILKVARDLAKTAMLTSKRQIAFVSDSELALHDDLNIGKRPIYRDYRLPPSFVILYASPETGHEAINRLLRQCDRESSNYLRYLTEGSIKKIPFRRLREDRKVRYRYMFRTDVTLSTTQIGGLSLGPDTKWTLYASDK